MVHLTVHLIREIRLCGPVFLRWMYPFERYNKILKGYVRNRNRPEGCIIEYYIYEEAIEFCNEYLSNVKAIGLPMRGCTKVTDGFDRYVLNNTNEVQPYINDHMDYIRRTDPTKSRRKNR